MSFPARYDIDLYQGEDFALSIEFRDKDGSAVDVSEQTFSAEVRSARRKPGGLPYQLAAEFLVDASEAATGTIVLSLPSADNDNIFTGDPWDLRSVDLLNGDSQYLLTGSVSSIGEVTT